MGEGGVRPIKKREKNGIKPNVLSRELMHSSKRMWDGKNQLRKPFHQWRKGRRLQSSKISWGLGGGATGRRGNFSERKGGGGEKGKNSTWATSSMLCAGQQAPPAKGMFKKLSDAQRERNPQAVYARTK